MLAVLFVAGCGVLEAADHKRDSSLSPSTEYRDQELPFLEATLDCRNIAPAGTHENLVPRGIILALGEQVFACFDTELLRLAAIWQGDFVTPHSMAMYSYAEPRREIPGGQRMLSKPRGRVHAATGLYPGWSLADQSIGEDPRNRGLDEQELGRGPLPPEMGQWLGFEDAGATAILHYRVRGAEVREYFQLHRAANGLRVSRRLEITSTHRPLHLIVHDFGTGAVEGDKYSSLDGPLSLQGSRLVKVVPASAEPQIIELSYGITQAAGPLTPGTGMSPRPPEKPSMRWATSTTAPISTGAAQGAYAVDEIVLPYPNPWRRRIRPVDIVFRPDGEALVLTFDGDVYQVTGLADAVLPPRWTRIAAGFNEPQSILLRDDDIFVFSRLGITRLVDRDGDGETDRYEMFCNRFNQSANTRDYPLSLVMLPDRSFLISKGGQQPQQLSSQSGRILHISADGAVVRLHAFGLRNGYLSVDPASGLVTASDQQGNWVPTSPLVIVREGAYYGYEPGAPAEPTEISPPVLWLPHRVAQATVGQVHGLDSRMGPLVGSALLLDFYRPGLLKILRPARGEIVQAAAAPLPVKLPIPIIKGSINPADGLVYFAGFQIEGSMATRLEGLCRLRPITSSDQLPIRAEVFRHGILLRFAVPLNEALVRDPANFRASSWEYQRSSAYGSAQYRQTGEFGVDRWYVHSTWPSADRKSVFVAIDGLRPTMQLELQHRLFGHWAAVYFTVHQLPELSTSDTEFAGLGFPTRFASPPTPRLAVEEKSEWSDSHGAELAKRFGCLGCHSTDGSTAGRPGPTWRGLFGAKRRLVDGQTLTADESYLRRAILDPASNVVADYIGKETAMPPYRGVLTDSELESLVAYLKTLR